MSSEKEEKKVLSRREALKRCAILGVGVASVVVSSASLSDCYGSTNSYYSGGYNTGGSYISTC